MWLSSLTASQRQALLGLAHNVVVSDGLLDPYEELMLGEFKREMELHPALESDYIELDGIETVFESGKSRRVAVLNLIRLSYVDGAFEIEEECFLKEVSRVFGIGDEEFLLMDNWVQRLMALEKEGRQFL